MRILPWPRSQTVNPKSYCIVFVVCCFFGGCSVRLHPGEKSNSSSLGSSLADLFDVYVNDAFGAAHRKHASIDATPRAAIDQGKPALAGILMLKELQAIQVYISIYTLVRV